MPPTHNSANGTSSATAANSLTLSGFTANAGTDRFAEVAASCGSGSPAAPTGVTWGGQAMTLRNTGQAVGANGNISKWFLKEANFPSGATGDVIATWAASHDERALQIVVTDDVDQTNPYRGASQTTNTANNSLAPTITVPSAVGDLVTTFMFGLDVTGQFTGIAINQGTSRHEIDQVGGAAFEVAGAAEGAGATNTTVSWTISGVSSTNVDWTMLGDSLQPATAAAPTGKVHQRTYRPRPYGPGIAR